MIDLNEPAVVSFNELWEGREITFGECIDGVGGILENFLFICYMLELNMAVEIFEWTKFASIIAILSQILFS